MGKTTTKKIKLGVNAVFIDLISFRYIYKKKN